MQDKTSASVFISEKKHYFKINKNDFFNSLKDVYKDSLTILEQFKKDFENIKILVNSKLVKTPVSILEIILKNYEYCLEKILLLCSKTIFVKTTEIIKNRILPHLHILNDCYKKTVVQIQINHIIKQVVVTNTLKLVRLDSRSDITFKKNIELKLIRFI